MRGWLSSDCRPAATSSSLTMKIRVLSCLFLLSALAPAQLSGTYTLDPQGSGTRNFTSFIQAWFELVSKGVSGPVVIEIAAGTYDSIPDLYPVPGASQTNTITLRSKTKGAAVLSNTISYSPILQVVNRGGRRPIGIRLENLKFQGGLPWSPHPLR